MKTHFKRSSLALAIGLLGMGVVAGNAHAGAYSYASTEVTLALFDGTGGVKGTQLSPTLNVDFSSLTPTESSASSAQLLSQAASPSNNGTGGIISGNVSEAYAVATGPTPPAPQNTFSPVGTATWYARSDTNVIGSTLSVGPLSTATASSISEISLNGNDVGIASANVNNNTGFKFKLSGGVRTIFLDLSGISKSYSELTANQLTPPSIAGSSATWLVTITDDISKLQVFNWTPNHGAGGMAGGTELTDNINLQFGTTISSVSNQTYFDIGTATALTPVLLADNQYTFRIFQNASTNVTSAVPEPSLIGLMGMGLLGAGAARMRRTKTV